MSIQLEASDDPRLRYKRCSSGGRRSAHAAEAEKGKKTAVNIDLIETFKANTARVRSAYRSDTNSVNHKRKKT